MADPKFSGSNFNANGRIAKLLRQQMENNKRKSSTSVEGRGSQTPGQSQSSAKRRKFRPFKK